ncbi:fatty acid desaturase family protein [Stenotrophobium rhamnosiphilum]|uniref:Fatty acid desaturase n=1 Tax=Stenotrophobium rhamnosiphilum TaxID=2029166 RepID=A0A2T5MKK6_9GAMM|nr:fatty acid desaturase [Stenotrophobium rhamnosiphilum]PTU33111.1 fatty acid desaturase [Stenotrophobium rhamnosiphilum]
MSELRDERLKSIGWKDLRYLTKFEVAYELTLSAPWLAASWFAAAHEYYLLALGASFMFFLTGLRQVHNAYHYALGLSRSATEWVMFALSVFMLGSMHAVQFIHLRHHRYCMTENDVEAMSARMPWWKAILIGPLFPLHIHSKALEIADARYRRWIWAELLANVVFILIAFFALEAQWLKYHVTAMLAGQCLTAFFAVWTVHHDCHSETAFARTIRHKLKALITYNMFYHVEHHLFPAVPTCKLPVLARRLDAVAPDLASNKVF